MNLYWLTLIFGIVVGAVSYTFFTLIDAFDFHWAQLAVSSAIGMLVSINCAVAYTILSEVKIGRNR